MPRYCLALLLSILNFSLPVHAQADGGVSDGVVCAAVPSSDDSFAQGQDFFERLEPACLRSALFYRQRGQWFLRNANAASAVESLERSILLDPEHLGTQLDYAQALLALGDIASALALISALQALPDVPDHLKPLLAKQLQGLRSMPMPSEPSAEVPSLHHRVVLSQAFGFDSNLNNAATASSVRLTYPGALVDLPLAQDSQPQSGGAALSAMQWSMVVPTQGYGVWVTSAQARARHTARFHQRYQQVGLDATWLQQPAADQQWVVRAELNQFHWGGRKLYTSQKFSVQHQWVRALSGVLCRPSLAVEWEQREYPGSRTLDGSYIGAAAGFSCQAQSAFGMQLRSGYDSARSDQRVGGGQQQQELRAQWQTMALGSSWSLDYGYQRQNDAQGYSPLLDYNAQRWVRRHTMRAEVSRPLAWSGMGRSEWFAGWEWLNQHSNLALFASRRTAVQLGMRWTMP